MPTLCSTPNPLQHAKIGLPTKVPPFRMQSGGGSSQTAGVMMPFRSQTHGSVITRPLMMHRCGSLQLSSSQQWLGPGSVKKHPTTST